jgi:hypothetical protein
MQEGAGDPIRAYITEHRARYTREAIRAQLIAAGHDPSAIDRALEEAWSRSPSGPTQAGKGAERVQLGWAVLLYLAGFYVPIWMLVATATSTSSSVAWLIAFVVGYAVVGLLVVGWVARWGPPFGFLAWERTIVGLPLLFALLVGVGFFTTCLGAYRSGLNAALAPLPLDGTVQLQLLAPLAFEGSGGAVCRVNGPGDPVQVDAQELGTLDGRTVTAYLYLYGDGSSSEPTPARNAELSISLNPTSDADRPQSYTMSQATHLVVEASADGLSGTVRFEDLFPQPEAPAGAPPEPISGSISWTCT